MQDRPHPADLVATVATFLQEVVLPATEGRVAFQVRVAVNALELVARQLDGADAAHAAEHRRLEVLLDRTGPLDDLNEDLCDRIARGSVDLGDQHLIDHLWATTMEKLAVDQPSYAAFRQEQQNTGGPDGLQPSA